MGKNSYVKTHPYQAFVAKKAGYPDKCFLHAEIAAIIRCQNIKKACTIIVTRLNARGAFALARPCEVCMEAIKMTGIKYIKYSNDLDGYTTIEV